MAVYQGTTVTKYITFSDKDTGVPIDVTDWTLRAQLRDHPDDEAYLAELTTENGGFVIVTPEDGRIAMVLDDAVTALLPVGKIHFDVLRENGDGGPTWLFAGSFLVKQPVTR